MKHLMIRTTIKTGMVAVMAVMSTNTVNAKHLSADEALQYVQTDGTRKWAPGAGERLRLSYTERDTRSGIPMVYVYDRAQSDGFLVLAADDNIGDIVLGYSLTDAFDPDNIPPGMQWLLETYAQVVGAATVPRHNAATRQAIEPLVASKWGQGAPYNRMCPVVNGERCVTGCVATAMAQVMRVHRWPAVGIGSKTYTFTVDDVEYQASTDFSSHMYDWDNMLSVYRRMQANGGFMATTEQMDAVAQLMYDCGVAVSMAYTPDESGASIQSAPVALVNTFGYDKSLKVLYRDWFDDEQWESMVYEQLRQGLPLWYSGRSDEGGHAFILDGYDGAGMYHFNWGWEGLADGYYSLANLAPTNLGTGAGYGVYNTSQSAIFDLRPDQGNAPSTVQAISGNFGFQDASYRVNNDWVILEGHYESYNICTHDYEIGLRFSNDAWTKYQAVTTKRLDFNWYTWGLSLNSPLMPKGEYDVAPVYRDINGTWQDFYFWDKDAVRSIHVINDGTTIRVCNKSDKVRTTLVSVTPEDPDDGDEIYPGHTYNLVYDITGIELDYMKITAQIYNQSMEVVDQVSTEQYVSGTTRVSLRWRVDSSMDAGTYYIKVISDLWDGSYLILSDNYPIEVTAAPSLRGTLVRVDALDATDTAYHAGHTYTWVYDVESTGRVNNMPFYVSILAKDAARIVDISDPVNMTFESAATQQLVVPYTLGADIEPGDYRVCLLYYSYPYYWIASVVQDLTITAWSDGIADVTVTDDRCAVYTPGGVLIYSGALSEFVAPTAGVYVIQTSQGVSKRYMR